MRLTTDNSQHRRNGRESISSLRRREFRLPVRRKLTLRSVASIQGVHLNTGGESTNPRRGAGKSFTAGMSSDQMSVSQEINDTLELIDQLRARFHQPKVYLVGFSYGTYLGILVAQRVPGRLHAYICIGQLACSAQENRAIRDKWIREQATRVHDQEALDGLDGKKLLDREKWLFRYGGEIPFRAHLVAAPVEWSPFPRVRVSRCGKCKTRRRLHSA